MRVHNQGDMYLVELMSVTRLQGDMVADQVILKVTNLAIMPEPFSLVIEEAFLDGKVERKGDVYEIELVLDAEHLYDGSNDTADTNEFLVGIAAKILNKLSETEGWGTDDSIDISRKYQTLN